VRGTSRSRQENDARDLIRNFDNFRISRCAAPLTRARALEFNQRRNPTAALPSRYRIRNGTRYEADKPPRAAPFLPRKAGEKTEGKTSAFARTFCSGAPVPARTASGQPSASGRGTLWSDAVASEYRQPAAAARAIIFPANAHPKGNRISFPEISSGRPIRKVRTERESANQWGD